MRLSLRGVMVSAPIFVFLAACVSADDAPADEASTVLPPPEPVAAAPSTLSVREQVAGLLSGVELGRSGFEPDTTGPYDVARFSYKSATADWPFGSGFAISDRSSHRLLWLYLHHGDFPPHRFQWADFDADGRADIFFHAGFEDVFETHVYLNRMASAEFGLLNFSLGYRNDEVYATPVDLDGDGFPELLVGEPSAYGEDGGPYCPIPWDDPEVRAAVTAEYEKLVGPFSGLAFRYGGDSYPLINLGLFERIQVVRLYGGSRFVTSRYPEHLQWRLGVLGQLRENLDEDCAPTIDRVQGYLEGLLNSR